MCSSCVIADRELPMHPLLMDVDQVAALSGEHSATVGARARRGEIPGTQIGKLWRFWRPTVLRVVVGEVAAGQLQPPGTPDPEPGILSPAELAEQLGVSLPTVMALLRTGAIPSGRTGRKWHIYWPVVRDAIVEGRTLTPPEDP